MSNNKGIPTIGVRGIQFRSRIEAQWAYIFEKLGWNWEYEPIDLEGYIPDFIIKFGDEDILIEIKGDTNIWKEEVYKPHKEKIIKSGWKGMFGILGCVYKITENWEDSNCPIIGKVCYFVKELNEYIDDDLIIRREKDKYDKKAKERWFLGGDCVVYDICGGYWKDTIETKTHFEKLWVEAKNSVQWKGQQNLQQSKKNIRNNNNQQLEKLQTIKEVLLHPLISDTDKKRLMRCYEKVKLHFDIYDELPIWGNTDVFIDNKSYIYKVNYDKSIQYLQTNDMNRYKKISLDGVPQSPIKMNQNDFIN